MTGLQQLISEGTEKLFFKRFRCETRLQRLTNDLQEVTFEDPDHVSFESTKIYMTLVYNLGVLAQSTLRVSLNMGVLEHAGSKNQTSKIVKFYKDFK